MKKKDKEGLVQRPFFIYFLNKFKPTMSRTIKVLLMIVLWFLYTAIVYKGCFQECCAPTASVEEQTPIKEEVSRFPLDFQWSDPTAFQNDGFDDLRRGHISSMKDDEIFEITGIYYEGETAPEGFANMGLARAAALKKLYVPDIPADRIRLSSQKRNGTDPIKGYFESASFKWIANKVEAPALEELKDRAIIRFPFNSTKKDVDAEVDDYLSKLAKRLIETGGSVKLTGHTDNKGKDHYNMRLSRKRAEKIQHILTSKGVKSSQIKIDYKGSSEPKASNDTDAGRHENRRVVVEILK